MTLTITFQSERGPDVPGDVTYQLDEALAAIGFSRQAAPMREVLRAGTSLSSGVSAEHDVHGERLPSAETLATVQEHVEQPKRERGKPAPGKQRRTAKEVAEDEAADKAEASAVLDGDQAKLPTTQEQPRNEALGISSGGERIDPQDPAEVAAIDAADEAAEADGGEITDMEPAATMETVREAVGAYQGAYGMPATLEDLPKVLLDALGALPPGALMADNKTPAVQWRLSLIPDNAEAYAKVSAAVTAATRNNPFQRLPAGL